MSSDKIAPFLSRHIPVKAYPRSAQESRNFCYRHNPASFCKRQADEVTMDSLQILMDSLPQDDQQAITHVWSLFSAAPAHIRNLMISGVLTQCCCSQLSYISQQLRDLLRIDFMAALPTEIAFKILSSLDATSLCQAAQVCKKWRELADDDVVWHRMCEQHIDRKCTRCGWGLPLLERKRLASSKPHVEARLECLKRKAAGEEEEVATRAPKKNCIEGEGLEIVKPVSDVALSVRSFRPWKDVYSERCKVERNWRTGRCSVKEFNGHTDGVMCLQFDDNMLVTGSYDTTIRVWDVASATLVRTLCGHERGVRALMFDDSKLISGSMDRTIRIWNYRTGECISELRGHTEGVTCLHFDSTLLASGSADNTIKIWNFETKNCFTLRGHTDWVNCVRIHSPSQTLFSAGDDTTIQMWDLNTKKCVRIFHGHVGQVQSVLPVALSADEAEEEHNLDLHASGDKKAAPPRNILSASLDNTIKLWDVASGECIKTLFGHVEGVWSLAADRLRIVSGAHDRLVKVWDIQSGRCEHTLAGHQGPVSCVGLSDSRVASGSDDGQVRMYSFLHR